MEEESVTVFYDGLCKFCDKTVQFLLRRNKKGIFKFATLQDARSLNILPPSLESVDSIIILVSGQYLVKSKAVIKLASFLDFPYRLISHFGWIPTSVSDYLYDLVAKIRYKLFGKYQSCVLPDPRQMQHFVSKQELYLNSNKYTKACFKN